MGVQEKREMVEAARFLICEVHLSTRNGMRLQEKREKVEAAKLPSERRPIPLAPAELENDLPTAPADVDAFNARMFDYYNNRCGCCCSSLTNFPAIACSGALSSVKLIRCRIPLRQCQILCIRKLDMQAFCAAVYLWHVSELRLILRRERKQQQLVSD